MPLVLKKSFRENIKDLPVLIDDKSTSSPSFFRVSDVPQILTKGKNLLRISGHPTNLKEGTQILIDIRDSNGNDIYYEIFDLNGSLIKSGISAVNNSIRIDNIMNGIYFIKIKFDNRIETHRIIKSS